MCTLPHHAGRSRDGADGTNRRDMLKRLAAMGLTAPLVTLILDRVPMAGSAQRISIGNSPGTRRQGASRK